MFGVLIFLLTCAGCSKEKSTADLILVQEKYDDGKLKEIYTIKLKKDGTKIKEGAYLLLCPDGRPSRIGGYHNGVCHGLWIDFSTNGTLRYSGFSTNGQNDSISWSWYESGQLNSMNIWNKGRLKEEPTVWDQNGNLKKTSEKDGISLSVDRVILPPSTSNEVEKEK